MLDLTLSGAKNAAAGGEPGQDLQRVQQKEGVLARVGASIFHCGHHGRRIRGLGERPVRVVGCREAFSAEQTPACCVLRWHTGPQHVSTSCFSVAWRDLWEVGTGEA